MTDEANQQKLYLVTTALPGPANECVFIDVQTEDGKDVGPEGTGAEWKEHPAGNGLYRLGPFARHGEFEFVRLQARHVAALSRALEVHEDLDRVLAELAMKEADLSKANNAIQVVRNRVGELEAELEDVREERDGALKAAETMPETQEESDALFDKWWIRQLADRDNAQMVAWYDQWQRQVTGTESEVFTLAALIEGSRIDIASKREGWEAIRDQLTAMVAAVGLMHPVTGEPLVEVVGDKRGAGFDGRAVFLTASGRPAEGWWFGGEVKWTVWAASTPDGWSPPGREDDSTRRER